MDARQAEVVPAHRPLGGDLAVCCHVHWHGDRGQHSEGAGSLFYYAGAAGVILLLVRHDEREAEGKEVRTGVVTKAERVSSE